MYLFPHFLDFESGLIADALNLIQLHTKCMHAFKGHRTALMTHKMAR